MIAVEKPMYDEQKAEAERPSAGSRQWFALQSGFVVAVTHSILPETARLLVITALPVC